jgi:hypothetical protein
MKVKYALLTARTGLDLGQSVKFTDTAYVAPTNLAKLVESDRANHWKKWIGEIQWGELVRDCDVTFLTWMQSARPDVIDHENNDLQEIALAAWYSMLFADPAESPYGAFSVFTGSGSLNHDGDVHPGDPKAYQIYRKLERPLYDWQESYWKAMREERRDAVWVETWRDLFKALIQVRDDAKIFATVNDFLDSFRDGRSTSNSATAIARFVEAAEAVLGVPKNGGSPVFRDRAIRFLDDYVDHKYLGWDKAGVESALTKIYKIRNERCHGKGVYSTLPQILGLTVPVSPTTEEQETYEEVVAKYVFLAEFLAKATIRYVLLKPAAYQFLSDRTTLEAAWQGGEFI